MSAGLAHALWGNRNPIGQRLLLNESGARVVIGEVGDVADAGLGKPAPMMVYLPLGSEPGATYGALSIVASVSVGPGGNMRTITGGGPVEPFSAIASRSLQDARTQLLLLGIFGVGTLLLALAGMVGVMRSSAARRHHEFGIRIALGAPPSGVMWLAMREALLLAAIGVSAGMLLALGVRSWLAHQLTALSPTGSIATWAAATLVLACALLASMGPALHAAGADAARLPADTEQW